MAILVYRWTMSIISAASLPMTSLHFASLLLSPIVGYATDSVSRVYQEGYLGVSWVVATGDVDLAHTSTPPAKCAPQCYQIVQLQGASLCDIRISSDRLSSVL